MRGEIKFKNYIISYTFFERRQMYIGTIMYVNDLIELSLNVSLVDRTGSIFFSVLMLLICQIIISNDNEKGEEEKDKEENKDINVVNPI